ncbi:hypothetical protein PCANC_23544 [Puccinia coronata f. sp. avenae]|uniref:Uncharacterized protein n=1 Tax=Puccinia coronata f. sp. avenae TaxID=200324 RepID=A0A2N5U645_9BASI|nr:hypothetical protein PCANC_23544 [Puccinia coronata f. sp. avenae]
MTSGFFEAYARLIDSNWFLLDEERIIVHEGRSRACFRDNHSSFTFILGLVHITVLAKHQQVVRPLVGALLGRFLTPRTSKQASASAVIYSSVYSNVCIKCPPSSVVVKRLPALGARHPIFFHQTLLSWIYPRLLHPSVPPRSHTVPPPTASFSFPVTANSADPMAPQRTIPKRAPTPPPPSSRASLRKQYEQIPMSEEERIEAEQAKARRAKEALAEWNRVNDALKSAGF